MSNLKVFEMPRGQELQDLISFCRVMGQSPFYKKLGEGGVMSILLSAKELGLPMMACLNGGMYNIDGKVSLSAQLMNALLLKNGHSVELFELTEEKCTINFRRKNEQKTFPFTYTFEDAKKAGYLGKNNWKSHLKDMLYCRCLSGGARKFMPDALLGCYIHQELNPEYIDVEEQLEETPLPIETQPIQEKTQIEFKKEDGFDLFVNEHNLLGESDKARYVKEIAKHSNKKEEEIINFAVTNKERFLTAFEKWIEAEKKK